MIKDIKWKPRYGEKYYYIDISGLGSLLIANMNEEINRESFINLTSDYYRCAWQEVMMIISIFLLGMYLRLRKKQNANMNSLYLNC